MIPGPAVRRLRVALVGLLVALPLAAQEWAGPASLEVRVEDAKGKSVQGAEVMLEYLNVEGSLPPAPLPTGLDGRCAIGGLAPGAWSLEVRKPGFMSYRAEILIALEGKPEIVAASQHNVPGAVSTLRVKLGRARNAPLARPAVVVVESPVAAPAVARSRGQEQDQGQDQGKDEKLSLKGKAPETEVASPVPSMALAPVVERPAPAPAVPAPAAPAPVPAPAPAQLAPLAPAPAPPVAVAPVVAPAPRSIPPPAPAPAPAQVAPPVPAPTIVPPPTPAPISAPPIAAAPAPAVAPAPAPATVSAPAASVAAPMARSCFECRPGESALAVTTTVALGGASCGDDAAARLRAAAAGEIEAMRSSLGSGCALLRVDLPAGARYTGFRYEAEGPNGRAGDCLPGKECPIGASRFVGEPIVRRDGESTTVLGLFEASADRRGTLVVYWSRTKK